MHGVAPQCADQRTRPSLGGEAGGRSLGFISASFRPQANVRCLSSAALILYDMCGMRLGKQAVFPNLTPKQTASMMLKRRAGKRNSDFGRRLDYPKVYY